MEHRYRKMGDQLGRIIPNAGSVMPHAMVGVAGVLRKRRSRKEEQKKLVGGSKVDPRKEYDPNPAEFIPGSM